MQLPTFPNTAAMTSAVSLRPKAFNEPYIVTDHVAYLFVEASGGPSSSGGVLSSGQTVWLEAVVQRTKLRSLIRAFVESIGVIMVDPRWLRKGETTLALQRNLALRPVEGKVIAIAGPGHDVFATNEADVLRDMREFLEPLVSR